MFGLEINGAFFMYAAPVIIFVCVIGALFILIEFEGKQHRRRRRRPSATVKPVIAYKKAVLDEPAHGYISPYPLRGVTGNAYSLDAETDSVGFHAYDDFQRADTHPQKGNVLLEVLLSGNMQRWDLGWVATHQRVLQMIVVCSYGNCVRAPKYFSQHEREATFSCKLHSTSARLDCTLNGTRLFRMARFHEIYPQFNEAGVVVTAKTGSNSFRPTTVD